MLSRYRRRSGRRAIAALAVLWLLATVPAAAAWTLVLADSATVDGNVVRVGDLARGAVPAAAERVVVSRAGRPGSSDVISRQLVLRRLVSASLANGVRFAGARACHVTFAGAVVQADLLRERVHACVAELVPPALPEAPPAWWTVELPDMHLAITDTWQVVPTEGRRLEPGRNLVPIRLGDGQHNYRFTVTVTLHAYGEIARPTTRVARAAPLTTAPLAWEWCDLTRVPAGLAVGRDAVVGHSAARDLAAGEPLREADLTPTPLIAAGEAIELRCGRGRVAATVRAVARQPGRLGQVISVRNTLTGRLVSARVAGPGLVEWSR